MSTSRQDTATSHGPTRVEDQRHYAKGGVCTACHQPAPCLTIAERAADEWRQIAGAFDALHAYLVPSGGNGDGVRTAPASKPPISLIASDLIQEIEDWAWFYASALMDESNDYVASTTTAQRLRDIAKRHGHFTTDPNERWVANRKRSEGMPAGHWQRVALDYCDNAHELRRKAVGLIVQPPPPRFMGPCMEVECSGDVYLKAGDSVARCVECDQGHDARQMRDQLWRALDSRLIRRDELRVALNTLRRPGTKRIAVATVRQWIHRGRLVPVIREPEMFRLADAIDLAGIEVAA